jgi:hypothetical protein
MHLTYVLCKNASYNIHIKVLIGKFYNRRNYE